MNQSMQVHEACLIFPELTGVDYENLKADIEANGQGVAMKSGVYWIRCVPTGKVYVGSTSNWAKRRRAHRWELNRGTSRLRHLQAAWSKYGEAAFTFEALEECPPDKDVLLSREKFHIDRLNAADSEHGLNCRADPASNLGVKYSEEYKARCSMRRASPETRAKQSEAHRGQIPSAACMAKRRAATIGKPRSAETRAKVAQALRDKAVSVETRGKLAAAATGKVPSAETREKLRVANLGRKFSPEQCVKVSEGRRGKACGTPLSTEHRAKIGAALRGKPLSEEHRAKLAEANRGKKRSAETRVKLSLSHKGKSLSPAHREKFSKGNLGRSFSEEHRAKISAALKESWQRRREKADAMCL